MEVKSIADLPLHTGHVPAWLMNRMIKLARAIIELIVKEYGTDELLNRFADAYWFQAFGNVLGFDWHSSGLTTVVTAAIREAISPENLGIAVCGGKSKRALNTPVEVKKYGEILGLSTSKINELIRVSRIVAKVDNSVLQDGFSIYHHVLIFDENGRWVVIQQGLNIEERLARRYHWIYRRSSLIEEPHSSIASNIVREIVMDLTSRKSRNARRTILDLSKESMTHLKRMYKEVLALARGNMLLTQWIKGETKKDDILQIIKSKNIKYLKMPWDINWEALKRAYEIQPKNFEELLEIKGLGAATIRGLALVSHLIYGDEISWKDPVKFSFAFGGKDGVPYPVNKRAMDEAINFLYDCIKALEISEKQKIEALRRLRILYER